MRYIQKGKTPESLIQYAKNKNAYFDGYQDKDDVREQTAKGSGVSVRILYEKIELGN